jgi:hypothetical protein
MMAAAANESLVDKRPGRVEIWLFVERMSFGVAERPHVAGYNNALITEKLLATIKISPTAERPGGRKPDEIWLFAVALPSLRRFGH